MATDLAIDFNTGDLLVAPDNGLAFRSGPDTVAQRIRVRLRIIQGEWILDPTNGTLGSRLREVLRLPEYRAIPEAELVVREALEPMDDITIDTVDVRADPDDNHAIIVSISYVINDEEEGGELQTIDLTFGTTG